ncbi:MAG TPA: sulfur carrier protein ThiS [Thermaerobacter sp.]
MATQPRSTLHLTVNGKEVVLEAGPAGGTPTVADLIRHLGLTDLPAVAVAVDREVVPRDRWETWPLRDGARVEGVRPMAGGENAAKQADATRPYDPAGDPLVIGGRTFRSRLFLGTGKYRDAATMAAALERSGTEMVTVAIRAMKLDEPGGGDILAHLDLRRYHLLPNTAGATTADQAVRIAHLAREALGTNWIKLEVIGDQRTLLPDLQGTLEATRQLVRDGFVVLPYCTSDLVTCLRLEDAGAAAVMPLAAPIGTGQGMIDWAGIRRVIERVSVPVVVDAGLGVPSDAAMAMELGASAVLVNTAIARAQNPPLMAEAFKWGVLAGRQAFLAGRMPPQQEARPSSPTEGVPFSAPAVTRSGRAAGGNR